VAGLFPRFTEDLDIMIESSEDARFLELLIKKEKSYGNN